MAVLLDLHPTPGRVDVVLAAAHEALDELGPGSLEDLGDVAEAVVECDRAVRRLEALKLKLLAVADSTLVAAASGHSSTSAWLASRTKASPAGSAREVKLATDLDGGLSATAKALDEGSVSSEHATVIAAAMQQLPSSLSPARGAAVETRLVEKAKQLNPVQLRRAARRALEAVEPDREKVDADEDRQLRDEEDAALGRARLTLHDNNDGTTSGHFTVPTLAAAALGKILDAMTSPRRGRPGATQAQAGAQAMRRDWAHERGRAFVTLLEHLPTDHLHGKVAATVLVKLDLETLRGQLRAAGLDTGDLVSAAEARRLACGSGILPVVLDGKSQPLNLGRLKRFFSEAQRVAGAVNHTSCAADGCDIPYAWTEVHHETAWSRGGRSDLSDLVPLCGFHHRRIHDHRYQHRRRPDRSPTFHRRT